jgi:hypothetical protein
MTGEDLWLAKHLGGTQTADPDQIPMMEPQRESEPGMETTVSAYDGVRFSLLHNPQFWPAGAR